ncbi:MAG TPA: flagellar basal-body rod protein FlgF [Halanaerobiales bacterium]|nr:flagellar basal-body rod protein FlgF [Halanaerobiales bacterium]
MIKGLYTAASAMQTNMRRMDITSNNLANADTDGFKKSNSVQRTFSEMLISRIDSNGQTEIGALGSGVDIAENYTDYSHGKIEHTNNKLDIALKGDGFFTVQTPQGIRYSRNGNFTLNSQNQIINEQGHLLLNENSEPIQTIPGREISIDKSGQIYLGELEGERINIVDFADYRNLSKVGDNLYQTADGIEGMPADEVQVMQGYLESSNVNIVQEMAGMIQTTRAYETNQKVIQTIDNSLDKAVNDVGRLG